MNNTRQDSAAQADALSPEEVALLLSLKHGRIGYPRPPKSLARDRLKRKGLIESAKPHSLRNISTPYWRLTEAGRAVADEFA